MTTTKISRILNKLMSNKGLRITELARQINLPQPTVHRIANGHIANPHVSSLKPIADFFSITIDQLKGLEPIPEFDLVRQVPLLKWNEIICWLDSRSQCAITEHTLTDIKISKNSYSLEVKDESMDPVFPKGTVLILDPEKEPNDRSYVVVKLATESEPVFRQLVIDLKKYYLKALSPDLEQFKLVKVDHNDRLVGVLLQAKRNYQA